MPRLIVLTPNPAVDITYRVVHFTPGATVRVADVQRRPGGKGLNVLRVLRRLGQDALTVLPLGGTPGDWILDFLSAEGARAEVVAISGETRATVTIQDPHSHPTVLSEPGPTLSTLEAGQLIEVTARHCGPSDLVVISGSLPPGLAPDWLARLVEAVHAEGARVLVDTSGPGLLTAARAGVDVLKPNADEAMEAIGAESAESAAQALRELGAGLVVLSQGSAGLFALTEENLQIHQPAVADIAGNPTGAGDAATAGLALSLLRGEPVQTGLRRAAALGASALLQDTAGEIDPRDYERFYDQLTRMGGAATIRSTQ